MPGLIQSVERATAVLHLLATTAEPMALSEIAGALGLAKSTTHGLVRTLVAVGAVDQTDDTAGYLLAADPFGARHDRWDVNEIRSRAMNWTDALAARTGMAVQISVLRDGRVHIVHDVLAGPSAPSSRLLRTGGVVPAHACALGRIHLAHDAHLTRRLVAAGPTVHTHRTITDPVALARELALVRDNGWACGRGDLADDMATLAAPIRDSGGAVMAAVGLSGDIDEVCRSDGAPRKELLDRVIAAARSISGAMGHGQMP